MAQFRFNTDDEVLKQHPTVISHTLIGVLIVWSVDLRHFFPNKCKLMVACCNFLN